jgi:GT2 family glycosyltransferase
MTNITMLVHNRPKLTLQALKSLEPVADKEDCATITIFDDNSEQELRDYLDDWCDPYSNRVVIHNYASQGTGTARNCVIERSRMRYGRGEYLYLSDNDVFFTPAWLDILIGCYDFARQYGFKVIGAYNHPYHQHGAFLPTHIGRYGVCEVQALALQSMLMRWEVWEKYGPFCRTPPGKVCQSEDVDFARKIQADGGKLGVVTPALVVNTGITNSFGEPIPGSEMVQKECPAGVICE